MSEQSIHEPQEMVMSAAEVWDDAHQLAEVLRQNMLGSEPVVRLQIPLSIFLSAVDNFNQDELLILQKRIEDRLAA